MRTKSLQLARHAAVLGAFALPLLAAGNASAAECTTLPRPVFVAGSSAVASFIQAVGNKLNDHKDDNGDADPITIIYQSKGSCDGARFILDDTLPGTTTGSALIPPYGATDTCDNTAGTPVDIGLSDVFADSCDLEVIAGTKDFHGPTQTMAFVVSQSSSRQVISAEAAYLTMGFPNGDGQTPWNDVTSVFVRDKNSGTQQMVAHAIGVPGELWLGGTPGNAAAIILGLQTAGAAGQDAADAALGILAMDAVRGNTAADVVPLAYQHYGQTCGYLPNSELASNDMQNTRDGHYMIHGPLHMFTKVDNDGVPLSADAELLINYMSGKVKPEGFDLIALEAAKSVVPECAMRVSRDEELGALSSFMPETSCECKFVVEATGSVPDDCQDCDNDDDCSGNDARPKCNYGFCEVQ